MKTAAALRTIFKHGLTISRVALSQPAGIYLFNDSTPFVSPCVGKPDEPMEEGAKEERAEKAVTEANNPDEEEEANKEKMEGEKAREEDQVHGKDSDEKGKKDEGAAKKNEAKEKTDDEKGPANAKKEVVETDERCQEESPKSQMAKEQKDKEVSKKAPISSFFGEGEFA